MSFGPLVSVDELAGLLGPAEGGPKETGWVGGADDLVVVDSRWRLADGPLRGEYEAGHIPGAVFADLDRDLSSPASAADGRHPLPTPEAFAAALARLGIGADTRVVVYDDSNGSVAARLWWMLTVLGRPVAVLDGGIAAWRGPLETGVVTPTPVAPLPAVPWPEDRIALLDEIEKHAVDDQGFTLLDARAAVRYRAEVDVDPRPGHIPGSVSAELMGNVDDDAHFLSPDALRRRYAELGADNGDVVVMCGSGVTSCHNALAMVLAGLPLPRLFVGSYSQWIGDPDRPVIGGAESR